MEGGVMDKVVGLSGNQMEMEGHGADARSVQVAVFIDATRMRSGRGAGTVLR